MPEYSCGDKLDANDLPDHYCEYVWNELTLGWEFVSSSLPGTECYCSSPPDPGATPGEQWYNYPCCPESSSASAGGGLGTYRYQNGQFFAVSATTSGGTGVPMDLAAYSEANPQFSFGHAVEFPTAPPSRAVYRYQNGAFRKVDETGGSCPEDLATYSKSHPDFQFLVTLQF